MVAMAPIAEMLRIPQLKSGQGAIAALEPFLNELKVQRLLVITSPELVSCGVYGHLERVCLKIPDLVLTRFDQVTPDPSIELVEEIVAVGRKSKVEAVVALGGGSPIDAAKVAAAIIASSDQTVRSVIGSHLVKATLPLVAVPTTSGTGSEVTPVAILTDLVDQIKKGVVSEKIIPIMAILDSNLTVNLPKAQTAFTGLDALTHSIEAFISKKATPLSDFYARTAIRMIMANIRKAYKDGTDHMARGAMQIAAFYAGIAFANAGVTAAHAFAYPLGARYHLPHGLAVILMLPAVLEYNAKADSQRFMELARLLNDDKVTDSSQVVPSIVRLCSDLGVVLGLKKVGVSADSLDEMASSALTIRRILDNNPVPITTIEHSTQILERAYSYT